MISQQDLDVRLQLAGCKFSDLAQRFNKDLLYGRKCVTENRTDLMLLNVYLEMLECVKIVETVYPTTSFRVSKNTFPGWQAYFTSNGVVISDTVTLTGVDATDAELLADSIVDYGAEGWSSEYRFVHPVGEYVDITGPCETPELYINVIISGVTTTVLVPWVTEGVCGGYSEDNCLTEEELLVVFDKISDLTSLCFQPLGFTYTEN